MSNNNPITNPNARMISGPVNVIRLEGNIHGIQKVIYLFMDYHIGVKNQTQCSNVFSQDVQKYFANSFYKMSKGSKLFDFFLEIYPTELSVAQRRNFYLVERKDKYIEEVVKFFRKIFNYDSKRNKVNVNKLFKNVRLHYLDIRDYYKHNVHAKVSDMLTIANKFARDEYIDPNKLEEIINLLGIMRNHLEFIIGILAKPPTRKMNNYKIIKDRSRGALDIQALEYLANKIKISYKYDDVRTVMNDLIKLSIENFTKTIGNIDRAVNQFNKYIYDINNTGNKLSKDDNTSYIYTYGISQYTMRYMVTDVVNTVESLVDENFVEFFARFTDIYFLRRFLDKDYITNAIAYSGALHSNTYVYVLVNDFNFKITHISHSKIKDMDRLNNEIRNRSLMEIQELILPENLNQCSDLSNFPDNFY